MRVAIVSGINRVISGRQRSSIKEGQQRESAARATALRKWLCAPRIQSDRTVTASASAGRHCYTFDRTRSSYTATQTHARALALKLLSQMWTTAMCLQRSFCFNCRHRCVSTVKAAVLGFDGADGGYTCGDWSNQAYIGEKVLRLRKEGRKGSAGRLYDCWVARPAPAHSTRLTESVVSIPLRC